MIILTGGAGFVGSRILRRLNELGESDILIVDNLRNSDKYKNLSGTKFRDYVDKSDFFEQLGKGDIGTIRGVFHQGACTDTMEYDGRYMMLNNYEYSKRLLHQALDQRVPFVYASSAAVYGHTELASEASGSEAPLNIYGYSKLLFDQYVRQISPGAASKVVGLRYFNVYGYGEKHKGKMSSMVLQLFHQIKDTGIARLFGAYGKYAAGEQTRDFVYVKDIVDLNMYFFYDAGMTKTIVNAGSGVSRTWNDLAKAVVSAIGSGGVEYIEFPKGLVDKYQFNTRADQTHLHSLGYTGQFCSLEHGVLEYVRQLQAEQAENDLIGAAVR